VDVVINVIEGLGVALRESDGDGETEVDVVGEKEARLGNPTREMRRILWFIRELTIASTITR